MNNNILSVLGGNLKFYPFFISEFYRRLQIKNDSPTLDIEDMI
ncbi:hypothetical protein SRCM100730_03257 [Bacillus velezensis]|nr:hypothetical protein S100072_01494 [Bacillus velezensis]ASB65074.1 hypothetical protein S101413_01627 [Bacillus velezensis]OBR34684.1 hypothetical protein SRCM100731_00056 [Bacillus velezensis]OCB94832.1 hypothetical protein SRCM100730_03257 [Bacillus velezensis]